MKKTTTLLLCVIALVMSLSLVSPALAADINWVTDEVGVLTDREWEILDQRAEEIGKEYQCDVAIVVISRMTDDDGAYEWAKFVFENFNFGYGSDKSGLLLYLSMEDRDYSMIAYGFGNTAFTDYGRDVMLEKHILPLLGDDKYFQAFSAYLTKADEFLEMARNGTPFDVNTDPGNEPDPKVSIAIIILLPMMIAAIPCLLWKNQMYSAVTQSTANQYFTQGSMNLTYSNDVFLRRTETRTKIESSSSSSSSGGTTTDSDGYSGSSGKF